jgi:hypothetical protein
MPTLRKAPNHLRISSWGLRSQLGGVFVCLALLPSCIVTRTTTSPVKGLTAVVSELQAAWSVIPEDSGSRDSIGWVLRFQEEGGSARSFYSVRNLHHQELGLVDSLGRAWKYEPFQSEPSLLGSGSVSEGVGRILTPGSAVTLVENSPTGFETQI